MRLRRRGERRIIRLREFSVVCVGEYICGNKKKTT
jgi:hypothetical protein